MNLSPAILVIFSAVAASFAWAIRGTIIGASKGVMLTGALLGLSFSMWLGIDNVWYFAAAGALGAWFGGGMTYSRTVHNISATCPGFDVRGGYTGIAVKGGVWFAILGGVLGLAFTAPYYRTWQLLVLLGGIPLMYALGVQALNRPHDNTRDIFPPVFFSLGPKGLGYGRRESWGGYLFIAIWMLVIFAFRGDSFALKMLVAGAIGGGFGFPAAEFLQWLAKWKLRGGALQQKLPCWKIMEFSLGFFGGLALALGFVLSVPFGNMSAPDYSPFMAKKADLPLALAWLVLRAGYEAISIVSQRLPKTRREIDDWEQAGHIRPDQAEELKLTAPEKLPGLCGLFRRYSPYITRAVCCYIPLALVLLGSGYTAKLVSGTFMLSTLLTSGPLNAWFRRKNRDKSDSGLDAESGFVGSFVNLKRLGLYALISAALLASSVAVDLLWGWPVPALLALYLGIYLLFTFYNNYLGKNADSTRELLRGGGAITLLRETMPTTICSVTYILQLAFMLFVLIAGV